MFVVTQTMDGFPRFYSVDEGRRFGSHHGWVAASEKDKALQFARKQDGEAFMRVFLPHEAALCEVVAL